MHTQALISILVCFLLLHPALAGAQQAQPAQQPGIPPGSQQPGTLSSNLEQLRPTYMLGPGDQILLRAAEAEELNEKTFRLDGSGDLALPLLGTIHAGGLTVEKLEAVLVEKLKVFIRRPIVNITVTQFRSDPVFLVGAFKNPGIYLLLGRKTLIEVLTQTGGLQPNASRRIKLTRRLEFGKIPLPNAVEDPALKVSTVEISVGSLRQSINPAEDIALQPYDLLAVERAEMVYVNGEVGRVGPYELGERDSISAVQLITMAGGLAKTADPERARVLRPVLNTSRRAELPLNLKRVLAGKDNDFPLTANDVLYVPRSDKKAFLQTVGFPLLLGVAGSFVFLLIRR